MSYDPFDYNCEVFSDFKNDFHFIMDSVLFDNYNNNINGTKGFIEQKKMIYLKVTRMQYLKIQKMQKNMENNGNM